MTIHQLSVFIENKTGRLVKVLNVLKEAGIQIIASTVSDTNAPGQAAQLFETFSKADINISYMYSFMLKGKGIIIFRTSDTEKAREVISLNKINFISEENLTQVV